MSGKLFLLFAISLSLNITAQDKSATEKLKTEHSIGLEGQFVVSTDGKGVFINAGGPALKFTFKKFAVSVNMMPSLRFQDEAHKPLVTPVLGCGPQLYFLKEKRFIVSFPCYYYTSSQVWTFTAGIGFLITRPRK